MKRNLLLTLTSIFLLASCGNANKPVEVSNDVTGFDTGIPSVELTTVYSGNESTKILNAASYSLDKVTSANVVNYSYQLSNNMVEESSLTDTTSISFFGADRQYVISENHSEKVEKLGKAITSRISSKSKAEYAVGDKGKLTYIKNSYVNASGKETASFSYNVNGAGDINIRRNCLSSLVSFPSSNA